MDRPTGQDVPSQQHVDSTYKEVHEPTSWQDAHDSYCKKHDILTCSINEIIQNTYEENADIPWELPSSKAMFVSTDDEVTTILSRMDVTKIERETKSESGSSSAGVSSAYAITSSVYNLTKRAAFGIFSSFYPGEDEYESADWGQEEDDALRSSDVNASTDDFINLDLPIIHLQNATRCLRRLEESIEKLSDAGTNIGRIPTVLKKSEWLPWCQQKVSKPKLSCQDGDLLLRLLVGRKYVKLVERSTNADLMVLGSLCGENPDDVDVAVALWDLQQAQSSLEKQLGQWSKQVTECTRKAIEYQRRKQSSMALTSLSRRKLLQERIDASSQLLMQLERVYTSLENSHNNKSIIGILHQSQGRLQELNSATTLDDVLTVQEDLQTELDHLEDVQNAVAESNNTGPDDDELLQELMELSIQDDPDSTSVSNHGGDSGTGQDKEASTERTTSFSATDTPSPAAPDKESQPVPERVPLAS